VPHDERSATLGQPVHDLSQRHTEPLVAEMVDTLEAAAIEGHG
jgi:hypothetical protein